MAHIHKQIDITLLLSVQAHRKQPPSSQKSWPNSWQLTLFYAAFTQCWSLFQLAFMHNFKMAYLFATIANLVSKTTSIACFMWLSWNLLQTNSVLAEETLGIQRKHMNYMVYFLYLICAFNFCNILIYFIYLFICITVALGGGPLYKHASGPLLSQCFLCFLYIYKKK